MKIKPPVEKNKEYIIDINDIGSDGQGIGKFEGFAVFVPETVVGEKIKAKILKVNKSLAYGKVAEILRPSPNRIEPVCSAAGKCGGCSLQHIDYKAQLEFKTKRVRDTLERIGGFKEINVLPTVGMDNPYNYRNKAQFPVSEGKDGVKIGFYSKRSHNVINCEKCYIQHNINDVIIKIVRDFINKYNISVYDEKSHKGIIRHILTRVGFTTGEIMVCLVINGVEVPQIDKLVKKLIAVEGMKSIVLNINREKTNVILGKNTKTVWGQSYITDYIGGVKFNISPLSFFQVNPVQTKAIYEKAVQLAGLTGNENVLDIYCGIGTISLFMAKHAKKVVGIEIIPEAIADAKNNAKMNGIENAEFLVGSAEDITPELHRVGFKPDVLVVDPPRKGCDKEVLNTIVEMAPQKVVYISCEPSTFARDLKFLVQNGYALGDVQPFDQFCHSTHVETVTLMTYCGDNTKNED
ncbi:23S rRNA (uracil(1939)-C(5))-methyltransferase RlmD [Anaerotignum faecicola]|nr:23S rRNA (uracil(1939)-C(5))-methyltransferase RlmD [Anaerotignum faecicola]